MSNKSFSSKTATSQKRPRSAQKQDSASQVQVHLFDENDDEDVDVDQQRAIREQAAKHSQRSTPTTSQTDRKRTDGASSNSNRFRESNENFDLNYHHHDPDDLDPYNNSPQPDQYHVATLNDHHHQLIYNPAYDSMSTILEVDSEASQISDAASEKPRDLGSLLEVNTALADIDKTHRNSQNQLTDVKIALSSPIGVVSPNDKFGGTLSALAAQMERLKRRVSTERLDSQVNPNEATPVDDSNARSKSATSYDSRSSSALTPDNNLSIMHENTLFRPTSSRTSVSTSPLSPILQTVVGKPHHQGSDSRTASAESLMMISVSPMNSPKLRFPTKRRVEDRPVVEVSNKSTITTIDLNLIDKMVEKYFKEHSNRSTQTIEFDCDDGNFKTIDMSLGASKKQRTSGVNKPIMKSIAVGTEKFSRERFSLLPQTKTRSTQTKPNLNDSDIGTSETRRFKMSHLTDMGQIMKRDSDRDDSNLTSNDKDWHSSSKTSLKYIVPSEMKSGDEIKSQKPSSAANKSKVIQEFLGDTSTSKEEEEHDDQASESLDSLQSSSIANISRSSEKSTDDSLDVHANQQAAEQENKPSHVMSCSKKTPVVMKDNECKVAEKRPNTNKPSLMAKDSIHKEDGNNAISQKQTVPNLKTELRVIIEFADARNKKRSEITSNSQIVDGILNKKTEVSTSRHVSASPRQVIEKLNTVGQKHSLLYRDIGPAKLPRQNIDQSNNMGTSNKASQPYASEKLAGRSSDEVWQEVSKSTVSNEIETDTRKSRPSNKFEDNPCNDLIMSSSATVRHLPDNKDAVELCSRAARVYHDGLKNDDNSNRSHERLLVESVAGFDENTEALAHGLHHELDAHKTQAKIPSTISKNNIRNFGKTCEKDGNKPYSRDFKEPIGLSNTSREGKSFSSSPIDQKQRMKPAQTLERSSEPSQHSTFVSKPPRSIVNTTKDNQARIKQDDDRTPSAASSRKFREEIQEENENRHQITRGGRLIYDDRTRERRFEIHQASGQVSDTDSPLRSSSTNHTRRLKHDVHKSSSPTQIDSTRTTQMGSPRTREVLRTHPILNDHQLNSNSIEHSKQQIEASKPPKGARCSPYSPPALFVDQTSNLSSDPETMDSGFVQSGAGSNTNINNHRQPHQMNSLQKKSIDNLMNLTSQSAPSSPIDPPITKSRSGDKNISTLQSKLRPNTLTQNLINPTDELENPTSLAYVDDDENDDALIEQLGGKSTRPSQAYKAQTTKSWLPLPPLEFRNVASKATLLAQDQTKPMQKSNSVPRLWSDPTKENDIVARPETELITRLTRSKFKLDQSSKKPRPRTVTKLEQNLTAPVSSDNDMSKSKFKNLIQDKSQKKNTTMRQNCRFRAQIMFESDTDSAADRVSLASSRSSRIFSRNAQPRTLEKKSFLVEIPKKELISETKYSFHHDDQRPSARKTNTNEKSIVEDGVEESPTRRSCHVSNGPVPNWDYSLKVNRMRGNTIDSKISTHIRHLKQQTY